MRDGHTMALDDSRDACRLFQSVDVLGVVA